jgi:hypothetical protein
MDSRDGSSDRLRFTGARQGVYPLVSWVPCCAELNVSQRNRFCVVALSGYVGYQVETGYSEAELEVYVDVGWHVKRPLRHFSSFVNEIDEFSSQRVVTRINPST